MKKILITHGHTKNKRDRGAKAHNHIMEGELNYNLAVSIKDYLIKTYDVDIDVIQECVDKALSWNVKSRRGYDFAISIHHNAFNGQATGTEVLYKNTDKKDLASELSELIADNLGIVNRGAKRKTKLYILNIGFDVYLEVCFIDNKKDYGSNYKVQELAKVIVDKMAEVLKLEKIKEDVDMVVEKKKFIYNDDEVVLNRILFKDENYIKVKDLEMLGLDVEWDSERGLVVIEDKK